MVVKRQPSAGESQQSADQRKLWSGESQQSADQRKLWSGESQQSADQRKLWSGDSGEQSADQRKLWSGDSGEQSADQRKLWSENSREQSADQRKLWSGDSREPSSEDVQTGENRTSADLPLQLEENTPLVHPTAESLSLANQQPASQRELLTDEELGWISQSNASSESMGAADSEFGFESTESSSLIADLVELQLNSWGRKVAALKENKMADQPKDDKKDESKDSSVEFFTELTSSVTANDSSADDSAESMFTPEPRDGSAVKVYFRNLTPDGGGAADEPPAQWPKFVNLTPDGYGTNVEGRPDASFEDVSDKKTDDLEARLQSLGRTGKYLKN